MTQDIVLFFDVDNTLLDNDAVYAGLHQRIETAVGQQPAGRFWQIYDEVRVVNDVVNIPAAIEKFQAEFPTLPGAGKLHDLVFHFPFASVVFDSTPAAVAHAATLGLPVILSDGDPAFQPHKIAASGLYGLFDGRVVIREHKDREFEAVELIYPARHYVMVDDKPRIHRALKARFGALITTIMVCQGHYGADDHDYHGADIVFEDIGEITKLAPEDIRERAVAVPSPGL
jgi:FMN phosphatase YigB (HAD superfamily)